MDNQEHDSNQLGIRPWNSSINLHGINNTWRSWGSCWAHTNRPDLKLTMATMAVYHCNVFCDHTHQSRTNPEPTSNRLRFPDHLLLADCTFKSSTCCIHLIQVLWGHKTQGAYGYIPVLLWIWNHQHISLTAKLPAGIIDYHRRSSQNPQPHLKWSLMNNSNTIDAPNMPTPPQYFWCKQRGTLQKEDPSPISLAPLLLMSHKYGIRWWLRIPGSPKKRSARKGIDFL